MSTGTCITQVSNPPIDYFSIFLTEEATTYELSACYNVSIDCHSGDMVANIVTSTLFDGKVYAKGSPLTCVRDINDTVIIHFWHKMKIFQTSAKIEDFFKFLQKMTNFQNFALCRTKDIKQK